MHFLPCPSRHSGHHRGKHLGLGRGQEAMGQRAFTGDVEDVGWGWTGQWRGCRGSGYGAAPPRSPSYGCTKDRNPGSGSFVTSDLPRHAQKLFLFLFIKLTNQVKLSGLVVTHFSAPSASFVTTRPKCVLLSERDVTEACISWGDRSAHPLRGGEGGRLGQQTPQARPRASRAFYSVYFNVQQR